MQETLSNLLSRKFILSFLAVALSFTLVMFDRLSSADFLEFIKWIAGMYVASNVASKAVTEYSK